MVYFLLTLTCIASLTVSSSIYLNDWAVELSEGANADDIAYKHGFINNGKLGEFHNTYRFQHRSSVRRRNRRSSSFHTKRLNTNPQVVWCQQQVSKVRVKRDYVEHEKPLVNDQEWPSMWYLNGDAVKSSDLNVQEAWRRGYTGKGVVVSVLDDGLEWRHHDIIANYDRHASFDLNSDDADPTPQYIPSTAEQPVPKQSNGHGTRCAGEIAAVGNNSICGIGVAFNAKIGGLRMLDGDVTDAVEARALSFSRHYIDIYSSSWGPEDNGKTVDGPSKLTQQAFVDGVNKGRNGYGSIYIWASGNGGSSYDGCGTDGYTNSIYTLAVSAVDEKGLKPWYSEKCSSILAAAFSSGAKFSDRAIITTDLNNQCTDRHTGTSASAPFAAGIAALALEANPTLTWRDMQYIVLLTSHWHLLTKDGEWKTNGAGRKYSHLYGYGLMDAGEIVSLAKRWKTVPPQIVQQIEDGFREPQDIEITPQGAQVSIIYSNHSITSLEHVLVTVSVTNSRRGDLEIILVSPLGTESILMSPRQHDIEAHRLIFWPFMSVFFWGENPNGQWKLKLRDTQEYSGHNGFKRKGLLTDWKLTLYGTLDQPFSHRTSSQLSGDIECHEECAGVEGEGLGEEEMGLAEEVEGSRDLGEEEASGQLDNRPRCTGVLAKHCTACKHYRDERTGNCVFACNKGTYVKGKLCKSCPSKCKHCTMKIIPRKHLRRGVNNAVKEIIHCLSCTRPLILHRGKCHKKCPRGWAYYPRALSYTSTAPVAPTTSTNDHHHYISSRSQFKSHMSAQYSCRACTKGCVSCEYNLNEYKDEIYYTCNTCDKHNFLKDGDCWRRCQGGFNINKTTCQRCSKECEGCTGSGLSKCNKCHANALTVENGPDMDEDDLVCALKCPKKHYRHGNTCKRCQLFCAECSGGEQSDCTKCGEFSTKLDNGTCRKKCPSNKYSDKKSECHSCHEQCLYCSGPTDRQCTACKPPKLLQENRCMSTCSPDYFEYKITTTRLTAAVTSPVSRCRRCHPSCSMCQGKRSDQCLACPADANKRLYMGVCVEKCPRGTHSLLTMCKNCTAKGCSICDRDHCSLCVKPLLLTYQGHCTASCPSGQFALNRKCASCSNNCLHCKALSSANKTDEHTCIRCAKRYHKSKSGQCVIKPKVSVVCSAAQYFDKKKKVCMSCHFTCKSCRAGGAFSCLSCPSNRLPSSPATSRGSSYSSGVQTSSSRQNGRESPNWDKVQTASVTSRPPEAGYLRERGVDSEISESSSSLPSSSSFSTSFSSFARANPGKRSNNKYKATMQCLQCCHEDEVEVNEICCQCTYNRDVCNKMFKKSINHKSNAIVHSFNSLLLLLLFCIALFHSV